MKLTIGYTAYHEIEVEAPLEIEEAYRKYQEQWKEYEKDPMNAPYPSNCPEEDKIRAWGEKIALNQEGCEELANISNPENDEIIFCLLRA